MTLRIGHWLLVSGGRSAVVAMGLSGLARCAPEAVVALDSARVTVDSVERHRSSSAELRTQSSSRAGLPSGRSPRPTPHQPSVRARAW
jgi:hypothetical protein